MKNRSFHLICLIIITFLGSSTAVHAVQNQLDGFRGHKWGSRLETFGEMEQLDSEHPIYKKPGEELTMSGVEVESIVYFFMNGRFNMAQVVFNSKKNFKKLIRVLEARHGKGVKKNYPDPSGDKRYEAMTGKKSPGRNRYWWTLEEQNLSLYIEYIVKDKKGQIMYFHELDVEDAESVVKDFLFYMRQGSNYNRQGKYDEAISSFTRAIELYPKGDVAYNIKLLSGACNRRGWAYYKKRQYDLAISDYTKAINIESGNELAFKGFKGELAFNNRGLAYLETGQNELAISDFSKSVELNPTGYMVYYYRGLAFYRIGLFNKAISDYDKAMDMAPHHAIILNQKAWMLATCPDAKYRDGAKAIEIAKKAVELSPTPGLDTLAAAYAEAGRFDDAITTQEMSISILRKEGKPQEIITRYEERLLSYRANRPWRE
jgi:tetratricopeptide (TPR) repeat protein